jgi:hypothetical protein
VKQRRGIRSPRKVVIRAGTFLLLGAIVNIAVAWGLMLASSAWRGILADYVEASGPCVYGDWGIQRWGDTGHVRIVSSFSKDGVMNEWLEGVDGSQLVPSWSSVAAPSPRFTDLSCSADAMMEDGCGWPFVALGCRYCLQPTADNESGFITEIEWGFPWSVTAATTANAPPNQFIMLRPGYMYDVALPLRPMWRGFAINTLFYAAILWLLFATPLELRRMRRIKRGLCPACAYPVGASDLCTECGKPVPSPLRGRVRVEVEGTSSSTAPNDSARSTHPLTPSLRGRGDQRPVSP